LHPVSHQSLYQAACQSNEKPYESYSILNSSGQSHLIFEIGSTGCVTTSQQSKLCYVDALNKPLENLDAIALLNSSCNLTLMSQKVY
jgi:hypothetical protein